MNPRQVSDLVQQLALKRSELMLSIHEIRVRSPFGPLKVRVTGRAVSALRSRGSRSLPAYVIAEQRDLIERVAVQKFKARLLDEEGFVIIDEDDLAS